MSQTIRINKIAYILSFTSLSFCYFSELFSQHVEKDASGKEATVTIVTGNPSGVPATTLVDPPPQMPNWPRPIPCTPECGLNSTARLVDLDGDGDFEVVAGSPNSRLYAWYLDGTPLPGWENGIQLNGQITSAAATADVDGDNTKEIFVITDWNTVYAFKLNATSLSGWPVTINGNQITPYVSTNICDIDGDNALEVIAPIGSQITVLRIDGTTYPGWPFSINPSNEYGHGQITATAAVGGLARQWHHTRDHRGSLGLGS